MVSWTRVRTRAFGGASASTTIRVAAVSHQPPVDPGIGSNETVYPSDPANA
jgi:hypothetical protein